MKFDLREKQEDKEPGQVKVETGLPSKGRKCLIWNREAKELIIGGRNKVLYAPIEKSGKIKVEQTKTEDAYGFQGCYRAKDHPNGPTLHI